MDIDSSINIIEWFKDNGEAIRTISSIVSPLLALGMGCTIWQTHKSIARKRAILDYFQNRSTDSHYRENKLRFSNLKRQGLITATMLKTVKLDDHNSSDCLNRKAIFAILNSHELLAVGIKEGILDSSFYKRFSLHMVLSDWESCAEVIKKIRKDDDGHDEHFIEFERLAKEFADCTHPSQHGVLKKLYWWIIGTPLRLLTGLAVFLLIAVCIIII